MQKSLDAREAPGPSRVRQIMHRVCVASLLVATGVLGCGFTVDLLFNAPAMTARADAILGEISDSDRDGIPDVAENHYTGTAADDFDTDGDGYGDGLEQAAGSDPADPCSEPLEMSGVRILVAPSGEDVYLVFLIASHSGFEANAARKALFVAHGKHGASAATALFLGESEEGGSEIDVLESQSGRVRSWVLRVSREHIGLWSVGVGMREGRYTYCDGMLVHRRANDCVYQVRFETDALATSVAEPTEPEKNRSPKPGQGFKECEQLSFAQPGSPLRHILRERCETRDHYICPSDCGALASQTIIDLKKVWLY